MSDELFKEFCDIFKEKKEITGTQLDKYFYPSPQVIKNDKIGYRLDSLFKDDSIESGIIKISSHIIDLQKENFPKFIFYEKISTKPIEKKSILDCLISEWDKDTVKYTYKLDESGYILKFIEEIFPDFEIVDFIKDGYYLIKKDNKYNVFKYWNKKENKILLKEWKTEKFEVILFPNYMVLEFQKTYTIYNIKNIKKNSTIFLTLERDLEKKKNFVLKYVDKKEIIFISKNKTIIKFKDKEEEINGIFHIKKNNFYLFKNSKMAIFFGYINKSKKFEKILKGYYYFGEKEIESKLFILENKSKNKKKCIQFNQKFSDFEIKDQIIELIFDVICYKDDRTEEVVICNKNNKIKEKTKLKSIIPVYVSSIKNKQDLVILKYNITVSRKMKLSYDKNNEKTEYNKKEICIKINDYFFHLSDMIKITNLPYLNKVYVEEKNKLKNKKHEKFSNEDIEKIIENKLFSNLEILGGYEFEKFNCIGNKSSRFAFIILLGYKNGPQKSNIVIFIPVYIEIDLEKKCISSKNIKNPRYITTLNFNSMERAYLEEHPQILEKVTLFLEEGFKKLTLEERKELEENDEKKYRDKEIIRKRLLNIPINRK